MMNDEAELPEHARRNRAHWDAMAAEYEGPGESAWARHSLPVRHYAVGAAVAIGGDLEGQAARRQRYGKCHFFISAAQLTTIVSGAFGTVSTIVLSRILCPSLVTE